jgi:signal transduction histidine kinase
VGGVTGDGRCELTDDYARALEQYLAEPGEPALARAHEIGRRVLTEGRGVLEMAAMHSRSIAGALRPRGDAERARTVEAAGEFFAEALAPFEMAHRGFWEANAVLRRLNDVLESQAKRIASMLHDDTGQLLASVHFALAHVASSLPEDSAREIQAARDLLDEIEQRLRNLAHELRPPILDDLGLVPALRFLADSAWKRWGLPVSVHASLDGDLPGTIETTLYRITQEALTNVAKHARATTALIAVHQSEQQIVCSVRDNGVGFDATAVTPGTGVRGLGLMEIEERVAALGGILHLGHNKPRGTELTVQIPFER